MKDIIRKEHFYNHPIQKVWKAISEADEISKWFIKADFEAKKGFHYTFTHEGTEIKGEVLESNPVYKLVYTWIVGDTEVETMVTWLLEEKDGGTQLILEHKGISMYPGENAVNMFNSFNTGWESCINNLDKHLSA